MAKTTKKPKEPRKAATKRQVKQARYKSFRLSKRIRQPQSKLVGSFRLFITSLKLLANNWKLFGGIILVYGLLTVLLVKGFGGNNDVSQLKKTVGDVFNGKGGQLATDFTIFSILLGTTSETTSEGGGVYQFFLLILVSLVVIWALRHVAGNPKPKITVRDAFYKGITPFVPVMLVLIVIGLQTIPLLFANFLYGTVFTGGLAVTAIEKGLWIILFALLILLTLYMLTSSIFALYVVTLPNVRPMQALQSARDLVRHRRFTVMRKVLFIPFALFMVAALITIPVIFVSVTAAQWVIFMLSMMGIVVFHGYMYHLYKELL